MNTTDLCNVFDMPLTAQQTDLHMGVLSTALAENEGSGLGAIGWYNR
jgi:hypothetical protein